MTKTAALYIRQSQTHDDTISPELQERNVRKFIEAQGWAAGEVYSDIDISGLTEAKRPGFLKLKRDYTAGKFDIAVADDFSRFSRNKTDAMALLGSMNIATAKEGVADSDDDFMPAMYFLLADKFSKDMSKRWRHALMHRLSKGLPPSGKVQFGYDKLADGTYVINPEQAAILREAYERYTAGAGAHVICSDFSARGLQSAGPRGWYPGGLFDLLDKDFYSGKIAWTPKKGQEPLIVDGAHEPILTSGEWARYRMAREARKTHAKPRNPKWWLSGLARCGHCGGIMVSHSSRNSVPHIQCSTYNRHGKSACPGVFRKQSYVNVTVAKWLNKHLEELVSVMPSDEAARIAADHAVMEAQAVLTTAKDTYNRYQRYAFENGIRPEESKATLAEYSEAIDKAQTALHEAHAAQASYVPATDLRERLAKASELIGFTEDPSERPSEEAVARYREVIGQVIEKVVILPATTASPRDPMRNVYAEAEVIPKVLSGV